MSLYDDVEREARHDWLNERDLIAPDLAAEAAAEWQAEEAQTEAEDRDRAERGTPDQDARR